MLGSTLLGNLNSDFINGENALRPKSAPKPISVYVESYEDVPFWRDLFHEYETKEIRFDIQPATHKGKTGALARSPELMGLVAGPSLLKCVDSDYDYLLPEHTATAILINESPYIFQTYSYSIENFQCYSESLRLVCTQATKHDKEIINFNDLLSEFSKIVYDLFLWNLYFRKINDHNSFTVTDFGNILKLSDKIDVSDGCSATLISLKTKADKLVADFAVAHPIANKELLQIAADIAALDVTENNVYLFIQGHTLKNNIVTTILENVCHALIFDKKEEIKMRIGENTELLGNEMGQYKNQWLPVSHVLSSNTQYTNCFLYQKIRADLDKYAATI